jgi:hypothetical protein
MSKYTVRITNDTEGIKAWVDQDELKCIMQPNFPGETTPWETEEEALAWANGHAAELEAAYEASLVEAARKKALEDAQLAALQAQVTQAAALTAILERLTNPSA